MTTMRKAQKSLFALRALTSAIVVALASALGTSAFALELEQNASLSGFTDNGTGLLINRKSRI